MQVKIVKMIQMNVYPVLASPEYFASILLVLTIVVHAQTICKEMGGRVTVKLFVLRKNAIILLSLR